MKKLKFITASAAIAALTLTACQNDVDFTQEDAQNAAAAAAALDDNAIQFGTYLNQNLATRAGWAGSIDNNRLKDLADDGTTSDPTTNGFGVFAYYTGTATYDSYWTSVDVSDAAKIKAAKQTSQAANFMFNQQVKWNKDLGDSYITKWTYSPLKYWPNEVKSGTETNGVDDQEKDLNNNNAYTSYTNGGNVSFFAYAPYVGYNPSNFTPGDDGIIAINGLTTLGTANATQTDPILTYKVAADGKDVVDLLWGTYDGTSKNVKDAGNAGVAHNGTGNEYEQAILDGYKVNADLTKQKTNGTINFAFKHALSKVGGSEIYSTTPAGATHHGFMVVLDLDDQKGAEVGGTKEDVTKVTITSINVVARSLVEDTEGGENPGSPSGYTPTYLKKLQGDFNLATGQWNVLKTESSANDNLTTTSGDAATTTHSITQTGTDAAGQLNTTIAEPSPAPAKTLDGFDGIVAGVLTTTKNVYQTEAAPLVFIPNTWPELTITVNYTVRTKDNNLANKYSEVKQVITKKVTFQNPVELNKQYNLLMHLGLTSVKFTASVSNWEIDNDAPNYDSNHDGTNDIEVTDVWVPRNVGSLIVRYANDKVASDGTSWAFTSSWYNDHENVIEATDANLVIAGTPAKPTWVTTKTTDVLSLTLSANTTFKTRSGDVALQYSTTTPAVTYTSEPFTITQYGRVPVSGSVITMDDDNFTVANIVKEGQASTSYTFTTASISNYANVDANGTPGSAVGSSATLEVGTGKDIEPNKAVFVDGTTMNPVDWITPGVGTYTVAPNETGEDRTATVAFYVNGQLVKTTKTITQAH